MPEAALAIVSTPSFEVVPSVTACEPLEFLKELISDGLERHQTLSRTLGENVINSAEVLIRIGWCLDDARSYLAQPGLIGKWEQTHFPKVSRAWLARLRRLSSAFARDLPDTQQRQRLGIVVEGLPAVTTSVHLRSQLVQVAPKSLNELFKLTGVLPAEKAAGKKVHGHGHSPAKSTMLPARSTLPARAKAGRESLREDTASTLVALDHRTLTLDECTVLLN